MYKLKFSKPSIHTYVNGQVTVCIYTCTLLDNENKRTLDVFKVKGISKCADGDVLNPEHGRKLADSRAKYNAYKIAASYLSPETIEMFVEQIKENLNMLSFYEKMVYLKKSELRHIKALNSEIG